MHEPWNSSCVFPCSRKSPGFPGAFGIINTVLVFLNSPALPFHLGAVLGPPCALMAHFRLSRSPCILAPFSGAASLQLPPGSLSNGVGKAGTVLVRTLVETCSPLQGEDTLCRGVYSSKGSGYRSKETLKKPKSTLPWESEGKLPRSLKNGRKAGRRKAKRAKKALRIHG